jgi:hypothetical protein
MPQDLPAKGIAPNRYSWALLMSAARYMRNGDFAQQACVCLACRSMLSHPLYCSLAIAGVHVDMHAHVCYCRHWR